MQIARADRHTVNLGTDFARALVNALISRGYDYKIQNNDSATVFNATLLDPSQTTEVKVTAQQYYKPSTMISVSKAS